MRLLPPLVATVVILAGCAAPAATAPASSGAAAASARVDASASAPQLPAFMTVTLTDVRSGDRFTLGDFKGKVTIVEGMAVW